VTPAPKPAIFGTRRNTAYVPAYEQPGFFEGPQTGELVSATLFRLSYGLVAPITSFPALIAARVLVLFCIPATIYVVYSADVGTTLSVFVFPMIIFAITIAVSRACFNLLAGPLWNMRLRYFHHGSFASVAILKMGPGVADRVSGLPRFRDYLFSLPRSGRHFPRRWAQNHWLFVAFSVVHQAVRSTGGRLPDSESVAAEYQTVMNALQKQHPFLPQFSSDTMYLMLHRVYGYYQNRGPLSHTFLPIGDLFQAVGQVPRTRIYPYLLNNQLEFDLGLLFDGIFDQAMVGEDKLLDSHQFHIVHGAEAIHLLGNGQFALHLMQLEHPILSTYTSASIRIV
jgi:hypothetical protein